MRSRSRCSPTASPSATPTPTARGKPSAGDWRSLKTAATAPSRPTWRPVCARLEAEYGDPPAALDYVTVAIRNYHDSGNTTMIAYPLAVLAALFDRLGRHEPAATIAGFALNPLTAAAVPEITTAIAHLRDVLGDQTYESLARKGETMTTAAMVTYAYDQIDQARAELNAVSK